MTLRRTDAFEDLNFEPFKELGSGIEVYLEDTNDTSVEFKNLVLTHYTTPLPFDIRFEFFSFAHTLIEFSLQDIDASTYHHNKEYVSYRSIIKESKQYLNITFKAYSIFEDDDLQVREISLSKEECYKVAHNLLYVLNTTHFLNK